MGPFVSVLNVLHYGQMVYCMVVKILTQVLTHFLLTCLSYALTPSSGRIEKLICDLDTAWLCFVTHYSTATQHIVSLELQQKKSGECTIY